MKILSAVLALSISASFIQNSFAGVERKKPTPCLERLRDVGQDGIVAGTALTGSGLIVVSTMGPVLGPIGLVGVGVFMLYAGEEALTNGIKKRTLARLIEQSYDGQGRTLNRFYNKYNKVAKKKNAAIEDEANKHEVMTVEEFAEIIKVSNENGQICKPVELNTLMSSPNKKDVAEFVFAL